MKITINNQEFEFRYSLKSIKQLEKVTGESITSILKKFEKEIIEQNGIDLELLTNIGAVGIGKSYEEMDDLLDSGNFQDVTNIMIAFSEEVSNYFSPNLQSQAN